MKYFLQRIWCMLVGHQPMDEGYFIHNNNVSGRCRQCHRAITFIGGTWVKL